MATNIFGGSTVQPSQVAYRAVALTVNTVLVWPSSSKTLTDYAARVMDVTPSIAGLTLSMPPANQASPGFDFLWTNRGSASFTVLDNAGNTLGTVAPGAVKYFYLTDASTVAGAWSVVLFGASSSALDASSLAGLGLAASSNLLVESAPVISFNSNYTINATDRGKVYVWTGGNGTLSLPLTVTTGVGSDFAFEVRNAGTGVLTLSCTGGDTIDLSSTTGFQPSESARVHSNGATMWYSVGRGRSVQFNFTLLVKAITGGTVTLTPTEAANVVQRYTGTLTSAATIVLPSVVQVYYVSNQTSGAFSVTFKCGAGTTVTVPTGTNAVLFCDGTNTINTSTTVSGLSSLTLSQGAVGSPSINYSGDTSTGIYQPVSGAVAVSGTGVQLALFNASGLTIPGSGGLVVGTGTSSFGAVVSGVTPTAPAHLTTKAYVDGVVSGGGYLPLSAGSGSPLTGTLYSNNTVTEVRRAISSSAFWSAYNSAGTTRTGYLQFNAGGSVTLAADAGATNILLVNAGVETMRLDASNNVSIGGIAPATRLHLDTPTLTQQLTFGSQVQTSRQWKIGSDASNNFTFYDTTFGGTRMSIDTAGNVGIGSAPTAFGATTVNFTLNASANPILDWNVNGVRTGTIQAVSNELRIGSNPAGGITTFYTGGGGERMRIDASGNVGIGAASAGPKLYVQGSFTNTFAGAAIVARDTGTSTNRIMLSVNSSAAYIIAGGSVTNPDIIVANNDGSTELCRFPASGPNFQAGPGGGATARIRVQQWSNYYNDIGIDSSGNSYINAVLNGGAGQILFQRNGTNSMYLDTAGNLSINGTPSYTGQKLTAKLSAEGSTIATPNGIVVARAAVDSLLFLGYNTTPDAWVIGATYSSTGAYKPITFATSDLERMRIDASGNVGIGRTSTGAKLEVQGTMATVGSGSLDVGYNISLGSSAQFGLNLSGSSNAYGATTGATYLGTNSTPLVFTTGTVERMRITAAGVIQDANANELGYKGIVDNAQAVAYTVVQSDNGKKIRQGAVANVTVNTGLSSDFACTVMNTSGSPISIVQGSGVTLRLAGTATTGTRTLAAWGVASILQMSGGTIYVISGAGVT